MRLFSLIFAGMALVMACNTDSDQSTVEGTLLGGSEYTIFRGGSSDVLPESTDFVYFKVKVTLDDTAVLQPLSEILKYQLPPDTAEVQQHDPTIEVIENMSAGDSAIVITPIDSLPPQARMQFPNGKFIKYHFYVEDIVDEDTALDDITKEKEANMVIMQEAQAKSPKVDSMVNLYLDKYKKGELDSDLQKLDNGLEIYTIVPGSGDPVGNNQVEVHYWGVLKDNGQMFDNSYDRGMPFPLTVGAGSVIKGWDEGVAKLHPGEEALLFIPSELGYGEQGAGGDIPANADLVFFVEVLKKES